jgi:hypothetical protein
MATVVAFPGEPTMVLALDETAFVQLISQLVRTEWRVQS